MHPDVVIGSMNIVCPYCYAMKFKKKTAGLCYSNGEVHLLSLGEPLEPLLTYVIRSTKVSKYFFLHIKNITYVFKLHRLEQQMV